MQCVNTRQPQHNTRYLHFSALSYFYKDTKMDDIKIRIHTYNNNNIVSELILGYANNRLNHSFDPSLKRVQSVQQLTSAYQDVHLQFYPCDPARIIWFR